ncbi:dienelactone hydrolase family protein [Acuticoccus sp. I52.16.1]|uniref:dienelactone hydrolase family protein n=1 Tax=Acuticoccus sp. I52.16.1 TaxID=2928472 RepID=UPI001FD16E99|nr:dienelactone hydrolase family protein [Acuticoccus sp. I52.16.1]UOM33942.1 dienelactone hydrolase family protein [Acuticoccus sp. I52.16.1]
MSEARATGLAARWRRARRWQRVLVAMTLVTLLLVSALAVHTLGRLQGWFTERVSPAALSALLKPSYVVTKPEGPGPFPTALLYHGCDGAKDNMHRWAKALVEDGWAAVVVDSNGPRHYTDFATWRLVCAGQLLPGSERAGDILVSIADAVALPFVDPERLALIGMSHGGWSIMELMTLDLTRERPTNLRRLPEPGPALLEGVRASVLVYPWCGLANTARFWDWLNDSPVLFVLATADIVAPMYECEMVARNLEEEGHAVESIVFQGATHGFDQEERSEFSPLAYNPEATREAIATALGFLDRAIAPRATDAAAE